ncbi:aminopeptidase C [Bacteroides propionicifaciens]|uniref:aminopeptidase C n=1 Tax=Bacteroides propionicifaciens TaxID=392838 RepID=UPI00036A8C9D|nr:C1 family peptidase [Bacteroides propionicifaciens]
MKKILLTVAACLLGFTTKAQEVSPQEEGFQFTTIKENPITSVKNQNRSSTCWSFSGIALLESELLRKGKGDFDLSEMFIVHNTMRDRANLYVRLHGDGSFSPGGSFYDVIATMADQGLVPQEAMEGIKYGESAHNHNEVDAVAGAYVNAIAKGNYKKLSPIWKDGLTAIYDTYLGECPENFTYNGKEYTPKSFADELDLKADDYISLTSYTHHPFYDKFILEIQDNWRGGYSYNLPIDELMEVMDNAVDKGYTIAWGSDVSEAGFTRNGIAVMPDLARTDLSGSDMARWTGMTPADKSKEATSKPGPELLATQEMRQAAFDNWETTDDHGMLIYGTAKDQEGNEYFLVKNSWGTDNKYNGIWYASKPFVRYKTMNIVLHKDALPKHIAKKLGLK